VAGQDAAARRDRPRPPDLIWDRHRHLLRLRSALREFFPAALTAFEILAAPDALELLAAAPDSAARRSRARIRGRLTGPAGATPRAVHLLGHLDLVGGHDRRSTTVAAAGPGRSQPGAGPFADKVAFELGQGGEDVEDELAAGGGGVDRLLQAPEPDPAIGQPSDGVDQMPQRLGFGLLVADAHGARIVDLACGW
jgi:hypothetical protein